MEEAAREQTDLLLALPALLLRPAPRDEGPAPARRRGARSPPDPGEDAAEPSTRPAGTDAISFSATLRKRLQKAEKGELAALLEEALLERAQEDRARADTPAAHRQAPPAGEEEQERRFERAIVQAEAHNTRRALTVLGQGEAIPRDERTRQAMREKACVQVPAAERQLTMLEADRILQQVPHVPVTTREIKQALGRLKLKCVRAPGPAGGRNNLLVAMGVRPGGPQAIRDWTDLLLEGLPGCLAGNWMCTTLVPCDQGPCKPPAGGGRPAPAPPTAARSGRSPWPRCGSSWPTT